MNKILWPTKKLKPSHQVVVGYTALKTVPPFLKFGPEMEPEDVEVVGRVVRRRKKADVHPR